MAKASNEPITAWIRQSRAKALAVEYLGDPEFVEREILEGLAAGEIPWRCVRFEAPPQYSGPGPGDPKFWTYDPKDLTPASGVLIVHGITTQGDSATRVVDDVAAYGIEYDRGALVRLKLLPPDDADRGGASAKWIAAEVRRMKAAGEIPPGINISDFARDLRQRMLKAAAADRSIRPIKFESIRNKLSEWGLWPV